MRAEASFGMVLFICSEGREKTSPEEAILIAAQIHAVALTCLREAVETHARAQREAETKLEAAKVLLQKFDPPAAPPVKHTTSEESRYERA